MAITIKPTSVLIGNREVVARWASKN